MIGKIKGILSSVEDNMGLIETASGVYYQVFMTPPLIQQATVGESIEIFTYLQVREDNLTLFGFESLQQHKLFHMLLAVDGVGPKSAYGIVSHTTTNQLVDAVMKSNLDYFNNIPGIGKKTAQKILLELSHKFAKEIDMSTLGSTPEDILLVDALVSLGFKRQDVHEILPKLNKTKEIEEQIKEGIQLLTSQN